MKYFEISTALEMSMHDIGRHILSFHSITDDTKFDIILLQNCSKTFQFEKDHLFNFS